MGTIVVSISGIFIFISAFSEVDADIELVYWMSKKSWPNPYSDLPYTMSQEFFDRQYTICPRRLTHFYIVSYCIILGKTSWTHKIKIPQKSNFSYNTYDQILGLIWIRVSFWNSNSCRSDPDLVFFWRVGSRSTLPGSATLISTVRLHITEYFFLA